MNTTYVLNICNILGKASMRGDMKCGTSMNSMSLSLLHLPLMIEGVILTRANYQQSAVSKSPNGPTRVT